MLRDGYDNKKNHRHVCMHRGICTCCRNLVIYILSYMLEHDLQRTSQYIEPEFAVMSIWDSQREKGPRAYYKK